MIQCALLLYQTFKSFYNLISDALVNIMGKGELILSSYLKTKTTTRATFQLSSPNAVQVGLYDIVVLW